MREAQFDFRQASCHLGHVDSRRSAVQENRANVRKRVLKTAQIILSDKAPKLDCAVRNLSNTGAWRTDTKMGVTFI